MSMSKRSVETLLDLVEIKLSSMQVLDREDARELALLESCRRDLLAIRASLKGQKGTGKVVPYVREGRAATRHCGNGPVRGLARPAPGLDRNTLPSMNRTARPPIATRVPRSSQWSSPPRGEIWRASRLFRPRRRDQ